MANDIGNIGLLSPAQVLAEPLNTRQFDAALNDAEELLAYAASNGLLPPGKPDYVVEGIVQARQAPQVTAQVASDFWTAYAHLARLVKPVTAASVRACRAASLMKEKFWAVVLVSIIIVFSIFLFMNNTTAQDTADLIDQQNVAALKLWQSLQIINSAISGGSQTACRRAERGGVLQPRVRGHSRICPEESVAAAVREPAAFLVQSVVDQHRYSISDVQ